ncbi:MAG TPA: DUF1302 family protein [Vicinamibacterales bacterium]|nr:DUF1302 family protein [Vicinamibacterales bacterium]
MIVVVVFAAAARAQTITQRGFLDGSLMLFPHEAVNDQTQAVGDFLGREEIVVKPARWIQFAAGLDVRANSHDQVEDSWRLDVSDRGTLRPRLSLRRALATIAHGPLSVDVGRQFIRWGKTDVLTPTDRFAPRDFVNVVDGEFLAVSGVRASLRIGPADTIDGAWVPRLTPSRVPLLGQRWVVPPETPMPVTVVDGGAEFPSGSQGGVRWSHVGDPFEFALSYYDGFNNLPTFRTAPGATPTEFVLTRVYPQMRAYGADAAMPTRWFTIKAETAYFTAPGPIPADEYVLYVIQLERQTGEWQIVGGYAGEAVIVQRSTLTFAPDRGLTKSIVGRASYTIDTNRSVAFETAVRQNLDGEYVKVEYSQARGQHWRATIAGVAIGGESDDFLGQYNRNSHVRVSLRYSF